MATGLFWIKFILTAVGGFLGWYLGDADGFINTLVAVMIADYVTAVMCAVHDRALSSKVGWAGIFRKIVVFLLLGVGHLLDTYVLHHDHIVRTAILFFYISNEGISLLENAALLGLPIPERLRDMLAQMRDRDKPTSTYKSDNYEGLENKNDH